MEQSLWETNSSAVSHEIYATCPHPEAHKFKNSHEIWYFLCELFYTSLS
jgi:hypothetical protein